MKKTLLLAVSFVLLTSVVYAETSKTAAVANKSKAPLIEKTQGKIKAIIKAQEVKGDLGSFTVIPDGGKAKDFKLIAKSSFYAAGSEPIAFADMKKGDKVTVLSVRTLKGENNVITVTQNK